MSNNSLHVCTGSQELFDLALAHGHQPYKPLEQHFLISDRRMEEFVTLVEGAGLELTEKFIFKNQVGVRRRHLLELFHDDPHCHYCGVETHLRNGKAPHPGPFPHKTRWL